MEQISSVHLDNTAIAHGCDGLTGDDKTNVFDIALDETDSAAYIHRPLPTRLIYRAADDHVAKANQVKPSFWESAGFVGVVEAFQEYVMHPAIPSCCPGYLQRKDASCVILRVMGFLLSDRAELCADGILAGGYSGDATKTVGEMTLVGIPRR
jgi:hypothetical protein